MSDENRESILVIDDTSANQRLYGAILQDQADVIAAVNGAEAMQLAAEREYAMIVLDVHLPDISGFDLAHRLRQLPGCAKVPILFVSAVFTRDEDAFRGYSLGAVDYLPSPVVPAILRAKAQVFIDLLRSRRDVERYVAQLYNTNHALKMAYDELEAFSYSVSHDLRNPLQGIIGLTELLQEARDQLGQQPRNYLDHISVCARQMNTLIEDLLTLAHISRSELSAADVDLSALAQDIRVTLEHAVPGRHVQWQIASGVHACGDRGLLRVLLTNLLENAWKYSARQYAPCIEFGAIADRQCHAPVYYVRDNGVGFDLHKAGEGLFKPFRRFHSDKEFEGTGIGLATAKRVVLRHNGEIWADSTPDHGTAFYFTLGMDNRGDCTGH